MPDDEDDDIPRYTPEYLDRWPQSAPTFIQELRLCRLLNEALAEYEADPSSKREAFVEKVTVALVLSKKQYIAAVHKDEDDWLRKRLERFTAQQRLSESVETLASIEVGNG